MSATHYVHVATAQSIRLSRQDAKDILKVANDILCEACRLFSPSADCNIALELDGDIAPVARDSSIAGGSLSESTVNSFLSGQWSAGRVHYLYVVNWIGGCETKRDPEGFAGCSNRHGNRILAVLDPPRPGPASGDLKDWYLRQAIVWAHELGHNLGLPDHFDKQPDERRLMYERLDIKHRNLSEPECKAFRTPANFPGTINGLPNGLQRPTSGYQRRHTASNQECGIGPIRWLKSLNRAFL